MVAVITTWPNIFLVFVLGMAIGWFAKDFKQFKDKYNKED